MQDVSRANRSGNTIHKVSEHKGGYFCNKGIAVSLETSGATRRERDRTEIRDDFMAMKGIDRVTFQKKHATGAGYKEWRNFAESRGLHLPA